MKSLLISTVLTAATLVPTHPVALTITAAHAPSHFLPGMVAASATLTVSNPHAFPSRGRVDVTDALPPGLTVTAAAGSGWSCAVASPVTCTRNDLLPARSAYPPIRIVFDVAADVPPVLTNTASVSGRQVTDTIPTRDACPYGWPAGQTISFPPSSGVPNPQRPNGCTLLDEIWDAEEFLPGVRRATDSFVHDGLLTRRQQRAVIAAAERADVSGEPDNSCARRIAFTYDDGPSAYRTELLEVLRAKRVDATFFDNGVRAEANPQVVRFQRRAGHVQLSHSYLHVHMDQLPESVIREEVLRNEKVLAPLAFKGIRPPFGGSNANVQRVLLELGYTYFLNRINTDDWLPDKTAQAIHDDIVRQLRPGVIIGMHDGPIDTTSGAATVAATAMIIDTARSLGYCFGVASPSGHVVAARYTDDRPVPRITDPVPYHLPLAFGTPGELRQPWVRIPSPLQITASHAPAKFVRGQQASLTLTVTGRPDGAPIIVADQLPAGLTAISASGRGWTCAELTCTGTSAGSITVTVTVDRDAPPVLTNAATLTGHGGAWTDEVTELIEVV